MFKIKFLCCGNGIKPIGIIYGEVWEDASNKIAYSQRREYLQGYELDSVMNYPLKNAIIDFVKNKNAKLQSISCVIMAQAPKLAPHIPQMASNIAKVLGIDVSCVNLSATTTEKLGALGNGDGIAAQSTVLLKGC